MDIRDLLHKARNDAGLDKDSNDIALDGVAVINDFKKNNPTAVLDMAETHAITDIKLKSIAAVHEWLETDDLDSGEGYADRLEALVLGIALDDDGTEELTEDDYWVVESALETIGEYFSKYDVSDEDISSIINDWDNEVADRVRELLAESVPQGKDAADDEIASFAYDSVMRDANKVDAILDATYKKKVVVKGGKKVRVKKRIGGKPAKRTPKQKAALKKMLKRSHSSVAMKKRAKSMKVRKSMGM